jgi:hypothetical protein
MLLICGDEAIEVSAKQPVAGFGSVEVRPLFAMR